MRLLDIRPADSDQRHQALDPARSFIVQAPAGSGKTELLIQRILALLAVVEQPEEILAITFTRKAAGEMQERLLRALAAAGQARPEAEHQQTTWQLARAALDNDRSRQWCLLENPNRLSVQTIDSFCSALVRRMPWLSRFGAQALIAEDAAELYQQAAERVIALGEQGGPCAEQVRCLLEHLDNRQDKLRDLLMDMLGRRDQWLRHLAGIRPEQQRGALEDCLRSMAEEQLALAHQAVPSEFRDLSVELGAYAAENLLAAGKSSPITALSDLKEFPSPTAEHLPLWRGLCDLLLTSSGSIRKRVDRNFGFPADKTAPFAERKQAMQQTLDTLAAHASLPALLCAIRELPPVIYDHDQWQVLQDLVGLLPRAVAELWLVFKEQGRCDFIEVAQAAGRALGQAGKPTDLLLHLDSRVRHILVDEFQDTSWGQFELLERLTEGWQADDGRSLFLVGDPMQSIYRFREAEVGLYLRARRHGIGTLRLIPLTLQANFRSQAAIVSWLNEVFPQVFPNDEDQGLGGVPYAPSQTTRECLGGPALNWHPFAERDDINEADKVCELVEQARSACPDGTVAVLVRSRSHLRSILPALRQAGLPYQAQEIDPLIDRPVVQDLLALTRALLHPGDRVAQLAVLRAPWSGLRLADLEILCRQAPGKTVGELLREAGRRERLSLHARQLAPQIQAVLNKARSQRGLISLRQLVEGAWLALGGPVCVDGAGLIDAEAVFGLLEDLDHGGDLLSLPELSNKLAKLYAAPDPSASEALQVMTVHKAKGLEFDTVILPGLGRPPRGSDKTLLRWLEMPDNGLLLAPIAPFDGASRDPIYEAIGRLERTKDDYELGRLLYVAATRAKRRLHLLGHARKGKDGSWRPATGSLLAKLWPIAEDYFCKMVAGLEGQEQPLSVPAQTIRRLPLEWRLPTFPQVVKGSVFSTIKPSQLEEYQGALSLAPGTEEGRHIGTVVHELLERIARDGLAAWPVARVEKESLSIKARLGAVGIIGSRLDAAWRRVMQALELMLSKERGRWLLQDHEQAESELALSGLIDGQMVHAVIDRSFIDDQGVRWIVDYKLSEPANDKIKKYLQDQAERYEGQVTTYCRLFQELEPRRKIRAALYFPLMDGWYEYDKPLQK